MQLRYVYSELGQGLRRNLSMHVAVILTLFVSLTLVGLGTLLIQQADRMSEQWGNELQITVFLCRDNDPDPACPTEV
ncbi:MAG: permease-like cell division protein FtsX, partial [Nocardioides sp.]